jgi:hypothetical protein
MCPDKTRSSVTLTRDSIVAAARGWMGTPFRHQGRNDRGIDCVGLVILTGKDVGAVDVDFDNKNYPRRSPHSDDFLQYFRDALIEKKKQDFKPGDIVVLKEPIFPCHCGIIGERHGELTLIHAYAPYKKVTEGFFYAEGWDNLHVATFSYHGTE